MECPLITLHSQQWTYSNIALDGTVRTVSAWNGAFPTSVPSTEPGVAPENHQVWPQPCSPQKTMQIKFLESPHPNFQKMILSLPPPLMEIGEGELVLTMNKAERKRNFSPIPPLGTGGRWKQRPAILISPDSQPCNHITTLPLHHHYDGIPIIMLQILPW